MTTIYAATEDQHLIATVLPKIAQNNVNTVRLYVAFDSSWSSYPVKTAIFTTSLSVRPYERELSSGGHCLVPREVLTDECKLHITLKGRTLAGEEKSTTRLTLKVLPGTPLVIVSDPSVDIYGRLLLAYAQAEARMDNLVVGNTVDGELIDLRVGADGKTYSSAGTAVRSQLASKLSETETVPVDYELGGLGISASGWNYNETYGAATRVRVKEGSEIRLMPGDVVGLSDYSNARYYLGYRDLEGSYFWAGWLTKDFTIPTESDVVLLVANTVDTQQTSAKTLGSLINIRRVDGAANLARNHSAIIASALDVDLGFVLGGWNTEGYVRFDCRYVTKDIQCLDFDIVLKRAPDKYRLAVFTYTSASGDGCTDLGWVTDTSDYIIPAHTYFRVMAMSANYTIENALTINPDEQYESELYNSIEIYPVVGKKVSLLRTAKTQVRIASEKAHREASKVPAAPPKIKAINHRGWHEAPENTLPAFKASKRNGFDVVECDVRWTSDGVPVLLHDRSINRTARNANGTSIPSTINIADITYETALTYDFGIWKSAEYKGTKIPTFEEFIALCRSIQLHAYLEIEEEITAEQAETLMRIVRKYGMQDHVTWISFTHNSLLRIVENTPRSRVGYLITTAQLDIEKELLHVGLLKTAFNEAFVDIDCNSSKLSEYADNAFAWGFPLEVWTINTAEGVLALPAYVSGVTSDSVIASRVIYDANIN